MWTVRSWELMLLNLLHKFDGADRDCRAVGPFEAKHRSDRTAALEQSLNLSRAAMLAIIQHLATLHHSRRTDLLFAP
jgi:hypothetical protein